MEEFNFVTRRKFVGTLLGSATFTLLPGISHAFLLPETPITVQEVINKVISGIPNAPFKDTVDTLKAGTGDQEVTGIVTTMFTTVDVIHQAIALKANFIIAHEPTFYNHFDKTDAYENDPVYQFKRDLLKENKIAVWRCHDYIHSMSPDGVMTGVLQALAWEKYADPKNEGLITLPPTPLIKVTKHLKKSIGAQHVRVIGNLHQSITKVVLLPGAAGGNSQIAATQVHQPDLIVCGELSEWETAEYIRDSISSGARRSLVVLGHAVSEEPGMKWMATWLGGLIPTIKSTHVASHDPFTWV